MESVTIKDIARICDVGVSTVSRAMNNHPDINQETKDKVMDTIRRYHYVPNNSARNLKRTDAKTIAVLVKGISNPLFTDMIRTIEGILQKEKYSMVLQHVDDKQDEVEVAIQLEKEKRLRGIVFLGGYFTHTDAKLKQISVPFVLSTIGVAADKKRHRYASVSVDDIKESRRAVEYLIEKGHKSIAIITSTRDDESIGRLRLEGYYEALKAHGIPVDETLVYYMMEELGTYSMESGYAVAKEIMASERKVTAIYVISDLVALGVCKAIFDAGKSVPEDYSIVGFDGLELARYYNPSITTMRQPTEEIARATVQVLLQEIRNGGNMQEMIFDGELVEGQSVKDIHETK